MKLLICLFLLFGCSVQSDLEALQDTLYELNTLYVDSEIEAVHKRLNISEDDYSDCVLLESIIIYNQKILYIFKEPSIYLKERLYLLKDNYVYELNEYIIFMDTYDIKLIHLINTYLNK